MGQLHLPHILSDLSFILKRLWRQKGLVACVALGLMAATALAVTIPLYADAANYNLLSTALATSAVQSHRPPFSFVFNYVGSWHNPITVAQYTPANQYMETGLQGAIGLPLETLTRLVSTDNLQLYPNQTPINRSQRLDLVKLTFLSGVFDQVSLVEGRLPQPAGGAKGSPIEALVSLQEANDLGLKTGSTYLLYTPNQVGGNAFQQPVLITGIWLPKNAADPYWFYASASYDKKLLVPGRDLLRSGGAGVTGPGQRRHLAGGFRWQRGPQRGCPGPAGPHRPDPNPGKCHPAPHDPGHLAGPRPSQLLPEYFITHRVAAGVQHSGAGVSLLLPTARGKHAGAFPAQRDRRPAQPGSLPALGALALPGRVGDFSHFRPHSRTLSRAGSRQPGRAHPFLPGLLPLCPRAAAPDGAGGRHRPGNRSSGNRPQPAARPGWQAASRWSRTSKTGRAPPSVPSGSASSWI